jgi:hypothetical protein
VADFVEEIESGDYRRSLVAMRDLVAHELDGVRCNNCQMLQIRSGETSALVLRLQKIIEDIQAIPAPDEEKDDLEKLRERKTSRISDLRPAK